MFQVEKQCNLPNNRFTFTHKLLGAVIENYIKTNNDKYNKKVNNLPLDSDMSLTTNFLRPEAMRLKLSASIDRIYSMQTLC